MARQGRRTSIEIAGATEAARIALTLGAQARAARRTRRQPLRVIARSLGISVTRLGELERGDGAGAPVETWVGLGIVLGRPLAVNFSRPIDEPRSPSDGGRLEIQEHILSLGRATGRAGTFELPTRPLHGRRSERRAKPHPDPRRVLEHLRGPRRRRPRDEPQGRRGGRHLAGRPRRDGLGRPRFRREPRAARSLSAHHRRRVPGSSRAWVRALTNGTQPPTPPGLVWFDPGTARLTERRRATIAP
jgi:hypothetical protein